MKYRSQMSFIAEAVNRPIKIVQCIAMYNEMEFAPLVLNSIYDKVDQIICVEGAIKSNIGDDPCGHSTDGTLEFLKEFKKDHDKLLVVSIGRPWESLEEQKQCFVDLTQPGDILLINDCLAGERCVPFKINGKIVIQSLDELFNLYLSRGYPIKTEGNKECIYIDNLETLSVVDIEHPEHTLMKNERNIKLGDYYKANLNTNHLNVVEMFENQKNIFSSIDYKQHNISFNARKKIKTLKNPVAKWQRISKISRNKTNKDLIRISQKYGETVVTNDHRVAIDHDDLVFKTADKFNDKLLQIGEIRSNDSILDSIKLDEWITDKNLVVDIDKLIYNSPYEAHKWPFIKNNLASEELEKFCELLGFYVAEGSVESEQLKDWRICGKLEDIEFYNNFLDSIAKYKFNQGFSEKENRKTVHYIGITSPVIIRLFAELCGVGAENKKIPEFLYHLKDKYKIAFLKGYNKGDGHKTEFGQYQSNTISLKLHSGLCLLQKQMMMQYSISHREPEQYCDDFNHSRVYCLLQDKKLEQVTRFSTKKTNLGKTTNYVYDLTVPETHNFCDADGLIVVHNCDEFYLPEDIDRIRNFFDLYPQASELIPTFLHFYRDFKHLAVPGPEWSCQHQRILRHPGYGSKYNTHPVLTDSDGQCTYFSPHYQARRFVPKTPIFIWHYGYARSNMDERMKQKQEYYQKELAKHNNANQKFNQKIQAWFEDTEPTLYYDGEHPVVMKEHAVYQNPIVGWRTYPAAIEKGLIKNWHEDPFYKASLAGQEIGNINLCMTKKSQPYMNHYHNGVQI